MAVAYQSLRLLIGLGVAAVLLAVAVWLIRATDWSGPGVEDDRFDQRR